MRLLSVGKTTHILMCGVVLFFFIKADHPHTLKEIRNGRMNLVMGGFQSVRVVHACIGPGGIPPQIPRGFVEGSRNLERGLDSDVSVVQYCYLHLLAYDCTKQPLYQ